MGICCRKSRGSIEDSRRQSMEMISWMGKLVYLFSELINVVSRWNFCREKKSLTGRRSRSNLKRIPVTFCLLFTDSSCALASTFQTMILFFLLIQFYFRSVQCSLVSSHASQIDSKFQQDGIYSSSHHENPSSCKEDEAALNSWSQLSDSRFAIILCDILTSFISILELCISVHRSKSRWSSSTRDCSSL